MKFSEAKRELTKIYKANRDPNKGYTEARQTFYCHCPIVKASNSKKNNDFVPDLNACGYISGKFHKRAAKIEWEHIMPASWKGHNMKCWKKGGRKNCQGDREFVKFEGDMHNLVPSVGEINATREHFRYTEFTTKRKSPYGACYFIADKHTKAVEPAKYTRGFIARTFLYMSERHNVELSSADKKQMLVWNRDNPPTKWECYRNQRIASISGIDNRFITAACRQHQISSNNKTKPSKRTR